MNTRALVASFLTLLAVPLLPSIERAAFAQQASDVSDAVVLKDGSRFRGAITELVPRDHVVILLPSGESRRYEMGQVEYAGPAAQASAPAAPDQREESPAGGGITVTSQRADVHVASDQHDVQLLVRTGQGVSSGLGTAWTGRGVGTFSYYSASRDYGVVCTAPCDARMPMGTPLHLAIAAGGGGVVEPREPVTIQGPSNLDLHLVSHRSARVGGWVLFAASLMVGSLLIATSPNGDGTLDAGRGGAGFVIALVGPLASLPFILQHDQALIHATPAGQ
jgi:hypothetical protein